MTVLAAALFSLALFLAGWSYLAYPAIVKRLARRAEPDDGDAGAPRVLASVEVLVSAADEDPVIAERVRNLLAQEVEGVYRITIGCDGSTDETAGRAREAGGSRVNVREFSQRRGKASVLNDLVAGSSADVLVFTDANTRFEPGAVSGLLRALESTGAGAACGRLILEPSGAPPASPETAFWDRETELKAAEGRLGVCLGANGAIYAARRSEVPTLPPDTTSMDDFLIPLGVLRRGGAVVFARGAVAREDPGRDARAETSRRFRIGVGAAQVLRREGWLWNAARRPLLTFVFLSRKAARWLAPLFFLLSALAALGSPALRPAGGAVLISAALAALSARLGLRPPRGAAGALYYFAVINLALAAGLAAGIAGYSRAAWKPVARS